MKSAPWAMGRWMLQGIVFLKVLVHRSKSLLAFFWYLGMSTQFKELRDFSISHCTFRSSSGMPMISADTLEFLKNLKEDSKNRNFSNFVKTIFIFDSFCTYSDTKTDHLVATFPVFEFPPSWGSGKKHLEGKA